MVIFLAPLGLGDFDATTCAVTIERSLIDHGAGRLALGGNSIGRIGALAVLVRPRRMVPMGLHTGHVIRVELPLIRPANDVLSIACPGGLRGRY